jgi:amino-acid N-acetyltransferase
METKIKIRPALVKDVDSIFRLIAQMADKGLMLRRSKYKIVTMLTNFLVVEDGGAVIGCAALSPLWTDSAEIISLVIDPAYHGRGLGRRLVESLLERGRELGFPEIISLTYQIEFFAKMGFHKESKDKFPRKLWRECLECPKLENCDETAMSIRFD